MKFTKSQNQSIYKAVRNFNRKIDRLHDKGYDVSLNKISTKSVKSTAQTKSELDLYLREIKMFSKRGAEVVNKVQKDGTEFLEYHKSIQDLQRRRALIGAKRELNFYSNRIPTSGGKKQAGTLRQMGSSLVRNLEKQVEILSREEIDNTVISATKRVLSSKERQEWFYDEFLRIMDNYGDICGVSDNKLIAIRTNLEKVKADKFIEMYNTEAAIKHILDLYNNLQTITGREGIVANINDGRESFDNLYNNLEAIIRDYQE